MKTDESERQYLIDGGSVCPSCGSDQIEGDSFSTSKNVCWQVVTCSDCGASWEDVYSLDCINNFTEGDGGDLWEQPDTVSG